MEEAIRELEEKIKRMQAMAESTRDERQKSIVQHAVENAQQVLANFREVHRILTGNKGDNSLQS